MVAFTYTPPTLLPTLTVTMVQELEKGCCYQVRPCETTRDPAAKKAGYDAMRRAEAERQRQQQEKERQAQAQAAKSKSYGSWGPVFKNKDHFASLHMC